MRHLLPDSDVLCLAADPNDGANVWAGTRRDGVLRSRDHGATWEPAGLTNVPVMSLAVSPHDPEVAYAGVKPVAAHTTADGGATWQELPALRKARKWWWWSPADPPGIRPYVSAIAASPSDPNVLLAGIELGGVLRSEDGGATWSEHRRRADRDCHSMCFHAVDGAWAYEAGGGGPAVSQDGGRSWRHVTKGLNGRYSMACTADIERPDLWYVSASPMFVGVRVWQTPIAHYDGHAHAAIYRSVAGGAWERLEGGLPQPLAFMAYALVPVPDTPGELLAGLADGSVWHGTDRGEAWQRLPVELGVVRRSMVAIA